jgi:hypothetical protein
MRDGDYYRFKKVKLEAYVLAPTAWTSHQVSWVLLNWIKSLNEHSRATRHGRLLLFLIRGGELNIIQFSGVPVPKTTASANSFHVQYFRNTSSQMFSFHWVGTEPDDRQLSVLPVDLMANGLWYLSPSVRYLTWPEERGKINLQQRLFHQRGCA